MAMQLNLKEEEMLAEKVKLFPVLYNKQEKGYKEKDVVINAWNAVANELEFVENGKKFFFKKNKHNIEIENSLIYIPPAPPPPYIIFKIKGRRL